MSSINDILDVALQGLNANRQALETTSQNIANANTPGYSKQKVVLQNNATESPSGSRLSGGVQVKTVLREHDAFVQKHLVDESKQLGTLRTKTETLKRIEAVVYENGNQINDSIARFLNNLKDLETHPESSSLRVSLIDTAEDTTKSFRHLSQSLATLQQEIDERIRLKGQAVETAKSEIADLNSKIAQLQAAGNSPNDLLDRLDLVSQEMSTNEGELIGLRQIRSETFQTAVDSLDRAAFQFATTLNQAYHEGEDEEGEVKQGLFLIAENEQGDHKGAARSLSVDEDLKGAPEKLVAALHFDEETPSPEAVRESLTALVTRVGASAQAEERGLEHQEAICDQLENYRASISGVSFEEESVRLMQYQAAMNAAAKAIKVGDEMMQTILSLK